MLQEFTSTALYSGTYYKYKVRARNQVGFSEFSQEITQLTAQIPDVPNAPTTEIYDRWSVVIDWTAPYNGGSAITSYTIEIRTADITVYSVDSVDCDGNDQTIIVQTTCTVPVATLLALPYQVPWGASIYAKIYATNYLGTSAASLEGNGAIILNYPNDPINLLNNLDITWGRTIGLTWDESDANAGGIPVIDYTVMSRTSDETDFLELEANVIGTSVTLDGFILGTTYLFKVKARNAFDFSTGYSNTVTILAAKTPEKPAAPVTSFDRDTNTVTIDWVAPYDSGSPIQGYKVTIR